MIEVPVLKLAAGQGDPQLIEATQNTTPDGLTQRQVSTGMHLKEMQGSLAGLV